MKQKKSLSKIKKIIFNFLKMSSNLGFTNIIIDADMVSTQYVYIKCRKAKGYHRHGNEYFHLRNQTLCRVPHCDCVDYTKINVTDETKRVTEPVRV